MILILIPPEITSNIEELNLIKKNTTFQTCQSKSISQNDAFPRHFIEV